MKPFLAGLAGWLGTLGTLGNPARWLAALGCMAGLGVLDYLTGFEVSFAFFYLIPVSLAAWFLGRRAGVAVALLSSITWYVANDLAGQPLSSPLVRYWNVGTRLGFFLVVAVLLDSLRLALEKEKATSRVDFLTGAHNARAFYEIATAECLRARRYGQPVTLAYIDLDNFKEVNDRYGHQQGDRALQRVAATIRDNLRRPDTIARLGGDEFALLLPQTSRADAQAFLPRLRETLLAEMRRQNWPIGFSIGVLTYPRAPSDIDDMVRQADQLMYQVKSTGKNSIRYAEHADGPGDHA